MPGADLSIDLQSVGDRGVRAPRHLGAVFAHQQQQLRPWMIAPVRPGETLLGASIQGETWLNMVCNAPQAPMLWAEIGLWYIPLGVMGEWMKQLITNTGDDLEDNTGTTTLSHPMGLGLADNPNEPGLQNFNRPWAGELGDGADLGAVYLPLGSRGSYQVAGDWYGLNNTPHVNVDSRYDNSPEVDLYVMSASRVRADLQGFADPDPSTSTSLATLMDTLSILARTEITYAEYLAAHGVDPKRAGSISAPVMIEHGFIGSQEDPHFPVIASLSGGVTDNNDKQLYEATVGSGIAGTTATNDADFGFVYGMRPMAAFYRKWNTFRTKAMPIPEPGIILGTVVGYQEPFGAGEGGAQLDATRLINGALWGDRSFGGIDETDFMTVLDTFDRGGAQVNQAIYNMLNLYVNGDVFGYGELTTGNPFAFRDISGRGIDQGVASFDPDFTTKLSGQLYILSDLVGGG